jgi:hypothetical protein
MPLFNWVSQAKVQTVELSLPLLGVGSSDITVTWPEAFADATYVVPKPGIEGSTLLIGKSDPNLKAGSRTATGCTITVTNSGLVSIAAGAVLHVVAYG